MDAIERVVDVEIHRSSWFTRIEDFNQVGEPVVEPVDLLNLVGSDRNTVDFERFLTIVICFLKDILTLLQNRLDFKLNRISLQH